MERLLFETSRDGYEPKQCGKTLTTGELIKILEQYDEETPVYFSNDKGYTYGRITDNSIIESYEDEED